MNSTYRIVDANLNRVSEGLRVIEDLLRFKYDGPEILSGVRTLRHGVRKNAAGLLSKCLTGRDSEKDPGVTISMTSNLDKKESVSDLFTGNFKRVQEGLRTIEETLKIAGHYDLSKKYEFLRFSSYAIEKRCFQVYAKSSRPAYPDTDLYCLTAEEFSKGRSNIAVVKEMIVAGVKIIQYREKEKKTGEMYRECREIRKMTWDAGVTFIVNDHIDIAMMCEADGIHIGQEDTPIEAVRDLTENRMLIGLSTHSPEQAQDAERRGADYIGVGPVFKTYTKKDVCDPVGFEYLEYVVSNLSIPFVAIGGIKEDNVQEIIGRGATCVAMVTEIVSAADIQEKIKDIRKKTTKA